MSRGTQHRHGRTTREQTMGTPRWTLLGLALFLGVMLAPAAATAQVATVKEGDPIDRFLEECKGDPLEANEDQSRLSDECFPLADLPARPRPLLELGGKFLGTGNLSKGIKMPGGAVWQPAFVAFGTIRTAAQGGSFPAPAGGERPQLAEVVGRVDLFGNLYLTQTERILVGFRPLDQMGQFTSLTLKHPSDSTLEGEFQDQFNATLSTLFFEGDFGELLPNLDRDDSSFLDIYFSVGRQPLAFGDGLIVNEDQLDMVGLTRANQKWFGAVNTRVTAVYAWGEMNRLGLLGNRPDADGSLIGLFSEMDWRSTTTEIDAAFVLGSEVSNDCLAGTTACGNGIYASFGDIRRIGHYNNTFRVMGSFPLGDETPFNTQGVLVHNQFGWTPHHSYNYWYVGAFAGIGEFRSAVRGPGFGGPVGATGILFAAPGIGRLGAILGNSADNAVGASIGHQMFFADLRQQLVIEVGGRANREYETMGVTVPARQFAGFGARYQAAMGRRFVLVVDALGNYDVDASNVLGVGRLELQLQL